jgi:hypothetical protein
MKTLKQKTGANGDVLTLSVSPLPALDCQPRSRFRLSKRGQNEADGHETALLSEDFNSIAQFDAGDGLEILYEILLSKFEIAFGEESARMDAADVGDVFDQVILESRHARSRV